MANAVAFKTLEGPKISLENDPDHCYNFVWKVQLFPTNDSGLSLGVSSTSGYIVQRVQIRKTITFCDDTPDPNSPSPIDAYEYFELDSNGHAVDVNADAFLCDRKTSITVTLSTGYLNTIPNNTKQPNPGASVGADGTLTQIPQGFTPTLVREYNFSINCCGDQPSHTFSWNGTASNTFESYQEEWRKEGSGGSVERDEHEKWVDGEKIE